MPKKRMTKTQLKKLVEGEKKRSQPRKQGRLRRKKRPKKY
tara:strand:- start:584 stop:703 length:120 start_codon:yes stop_codon:yes gene_type:complete